MRLRKKYLNKEVLNINLSCNALKQKGIKQHSACQFLFSCLSVLRTTLDLVSFLAALSHLRPPPRLQTLLHSLLPFLVVYLLIYLFGYIRSQLQHAQSSLHHGGSFLATHGLQLQCSGLVAPRHVGSQFPHQGLDLRETPALQGRFLTTGPSGKSFSASFLLLHFCPVIRQLL